MRKITRLTLITFLTVALAACSSDSGGMSDSAGAMADSSPGGSTGGTSTGSTTGAGAAEWTGSDGGDGTTGGSTGGGSTGMSQDAGIAAPPVEPEVPGDPTTSNEGDDFVDVGTNPFVMADSDPQSTFAADVDTASYDIFRRDIQQLNDVPQPKSVRLEEYVNYFDYSYEPPTTDSAEPFTINMEAAPSPFVAGTTVVRVGIQGRALEDMQEKPANVVFLVDSSGSMGNAAKMPLVRKTLDAALDVLQPTDKVTIVTYAGGVGVALAPTAVSSKATIEAAISKLKTGGGTAGASGINEAYKQAAAAFIDGGINHVIMCTDGDFNLGLSSDQDLVELIVEKRQTGVTFTALGFGSGNLNDSMMEKVSNAGNGTYSVITDEDDAVDYAHHKLLQNLYFIAKDMKIQVTFNPDKVYAYRLLGYEINDIPDHLFEDDTVDAGEVGAGHSVTALYELVMEGDEVPTVEGAPKPQDGDIFDGEISVMPEELVRVAVRWKDVTATEADAAYQTSVGITQSDVLNDLDNASQDFRWAAAIAAFAEILKDSPYADAGNIEAIDSIVAEDPQTDWAREEFANLYEEAKTRLGL